MTQAQFSRWLGVSIKQVKYLEHQRRNPSGPARRLLGILADQLGFGSTTPVQVLGASPADLKSPSRSPRREKAPSKPRDDVDAATVPATKTDISVSVADDDAFVWR